jgi:hypothetical protein
MSLDGTKYWYNGLPVDGLDQSGSTGATKYWYDGLPVAIIATGSSPPEPSASGPGMYSSTGAMNVVSNDTSVSRGRYTSSGSTRITLVSGSSYTGLYAADGSINVVNEDGPLSHPCGAIRGRAALTTYTGLYSPSGALYMAGL